MRAIFENEPLYENGNYFLPFDNLFIRRSTFYQNEKPVQAIRIRTIQPLQRGFFRLDGSKRYDRKERALYRFSVPALFDGSFPWRGTTPRPQKAQ